MYYTLLVDISWGGFMDECLPLAGQARLQSLVWRLAKGSCTHTGPHGPGAPPSFGKLLQPCSSGPLGFFWRCTCHSSSSGWWGEEFLPLAVQSIAYSQLELLRWSSCRKFQKHSHGLMEQLEKVWPFWDHLHGRKVWGLGSSPLVGAACPHHGPLWADQRQDGWWHGPPTAPLPPFLHVLVVLVVLWRWLPQNCCPGTDRRVHWLLPERHHFSARHLFLSNLALLLLLLRFFFFWYPHFFKVTIFFSQLLFTHPSLFQAFNAWAAWAHLEKRLWTSSVPFEQQGLWTSLIHVAKNNALGTLDSSGKAELWAF